MILVKTITEDFSLQSKDFSEAEDIHFDFTELKKINSIGIKNFINFLKDLSPTNRIYYHHCPPRFIQLLNIVNGLFPPQVETKSLFVAYFCPHCQNDYSFEVFAPFQKEMLHVIRECPEDATPLELFNRESIIFNFLKSKSVA
jgi:hypothetical protein